MLFYLLLLGLFVGRNGMVVLKSDLTFTRNHSASTHTVEWKKMEIHGNM